MSSLQMVSYLNYNNIKIIIFFDIAWPYNPRDGETTKEENQTVL